MGKKMGRQATTVPVSIIYTDHWVDVLFKRFSSRYVIDSHGCQLWLKSRHILSIAAVAGDLPTDGFRGLGVGAFETGERVGPKPTVEGR